MTPKEKADPSPRPPSAGSFRMTTLGDSGTIAEKITTSPAKEKAEKHSRG
jgi:hypothetical protein